MSLPGVPDDRRPVVGMVVATSTGGIGAHVGSLLPRVAARGWDVVVAAPAAVLADLGLVAGHREGGIRPAAVEIPTSPWAGTGWVGPARHGPVAELRALLAGVDVVHAHGLRAGRAAVAARRRGTPAVVTWHNPPPTGGATGLAAGVALRRLVGATQVTLGASADLVATARAAGAADARLCEVAAPSPPPPDPAAVAAARASLELAPGRPLVLSAGRLTAQKDHPTLLAAAGLLAAREVPPLVAVAGDGPDGAALADRVAADGLPVALLGRRRDVPALLAGSDVAVLTSRWEARSLFAQEALRAGVPLVATAVGGVPELVGDAAVLLAPGAPQAVADAVARVLDLPGLAERLRAAGPARAAGWPGEDDTAAVVAAVYDELLLLGS